MNRPFARVWGLSQGLLGRSRTTSPSLTAVGPNSYLDEHDFLKMLGAAFVFHLLVFIIAALLPDDKVTNIPVRALSFKLGDQDRVAAYAPAPTPAVAPASAPAPTMKAMAREIPMEVPKQIEPPKPVKPAKVMPTPEPTRQVPLENQQPKPEPAPESLPPAVAPTPQQFVREVGAAPTQAVNAAVARAGIPTGAIGGQGTETTMTEQTAQAVRARYEQQISAWIQHHKFYPADAGGREGRAVVRMRIDRAGNVRYYAIEQSAGMTALDMAALEMIRRANPVPAVPANYPAGNLVEFLIPITFRAPQ